MAVILHMVPEREWEEARAAGSYAPASLLRDGFIHCSRPEQVLRVANGVFRGRGDLVLLAIDTRRVSAEIRYENCEGGELLFPHVYGPLDPAAVTAVLPFPAQADGTFRLPEQLGPPDERSR